MVKLGVKGLMITIRYRYVHMGAVRARTQLREGVIDLLCACVIWAMEVGLLFASVVFAMHSGR